MLWMDKPTDNKGITTWYIYKVPALSIAGSYWIPVNSGK